MEKGFAYGMRLRGFSPGAQPRGGYICHLDDLTGKYYDIVVYDRQLTTDEVYGYDLEYIGPCHREWVFD